jgi:uncharacterized coiled-coil DUF342 family protein
MMVEELLNVAANSTSLLYASVALLFIVAAIMIGGVTVARSELAETDYRQKIDLMPSLNELRAADASLKEKRLEREELLEELKGLQQEYAEARRHQLDAEHWQTLAEQAKSDYDSRQDFVDEVEALRRDYEDEAAKLATLRNEIEDKIHELSSVNRKIEEATDELDTLVARRQEADDLTEQLTDLSQRRDDLLRELQEIKDQRDERLRAGFEVNQLAQQKAELDQALVELPDQVSKLRTERDELAGETERLREARNETDRLQAQKTALATSIETLEREKERLEGELGPIKVGAGADGDNEVEDSERIADLVQRPSCLFGDGDNLLLPNKIDETDELAMLKRLDGHLTDLNLEFSERVLYRFHTSLKTGFISPLTVLAGISGTGKSQLPQRYAEAMGMHFLKVAVQPRWDSPQDLLGFYNYLEQSYKATELARALVRMDENFELPHDQLHASDRVLLVLLDEMNLARVEYYFSEFLSRLEGRPEAGTKNTDLLMPGQIEIDIPRRVGNTLSVYPGHNVLFVGTMNEDESTQALSDKVLDRANTLRFRKPEKLKSQALEELTNSSIEHLPFRTWLSWQKKADALEKAHAEQTDEFVEKLNSLLSQIDRPFGHRINQAIHAYVANYPNLSIEANVQCALADTLALRVLPKLRGIELEDNRAHVLGQIADLAIDHLADEELAISIKQGLGSQDVFHWTG